jgi:drug/metabolite transporter (DMT)-like permease
LALLTAFALLAVGETMGERPPAGLGIAGTLFVTAAIVGDNIHEQGSGIGALVAGLFLLAGALFAIRGTEAEMSTSPPIPPTPPIPPAPPEPPAGSSPPGLD